MKQIIIVFAVLLCTACQREHDDVQNQANFTVLNDMSNRFFLRPYANGILREYHIELNTQQACAFRITGITDKRLHSADDMYLEAGDIYIEVNKPRPIYFRENRVQDFYYWVRKAVDKSNNEAIAIDSLSNTECYRTIIDELSLLSRKPGNRRVLFIFSDLNENSNIYNSYSSGGRELLMKNPKAVADSLKKSYSIPSTILPTEIVVVYQSANRANDELFFQWITVYTYLFKQVPVTIRVQATNKSYDI